MSRDEIEAGTVWKVGAVLVLMAATAAVYWQINRHSFVDFDDTIYVTENATVQRGLTWQGLVYAFTNVDAASWYPLTWLTHLADVSIWGMRASGHLSTNLFLHLLNTALLLGLLDRMTGSFWRSWFVAALFALHPLHVESVAWVSERKDVLSTLFWFLTLWAYSLYAERGRAGEYILACIALLLGLLSKPMLVTVPFALLLLDFWPLGRYEPKARVGRSWGLQAIWLTVEKLPMFVLAAVMSIITIVAQHGSKAMTSVEAMPLGMRVSNAAYSYANYLLNAIWPLNLAAYYPHPLGTLSALQVVGAAVFLILVTLCAILFAWKYPYLPVGWFWYLGTLVPVIGIIQVGTQGWADRYTYVPMIGVFIAVVWGLADLVLTKPLARGLTATLGVLALAFFSLLTYRQVGFWRDSETLFSRALAVTTNNDICNWGLSRALIKRGAYDEGIAHLQEAIRIRPNDHRFIADLGKAYLDLGNLEGAEACFQRVLELNPGNLPAMNNLASALLRQKKLEEAGPLLQKCIEQQPDKPDAYSNYGALLLYQGKYQEAADFLGRAVGRFPMNAALRNNFGGALMNLNLRDDAIAQFREALRLDPSNQDAKRNLDAILSKTPGTP